MQISSEMQASGKSKRPSAYLSWLREPLVHFLIVGALMFVGYRIVNPAPDASVDSQRIELTKDDLRQLVAKWLAQGRPMPTPEQVHGLAEQKVREDILSREAVALGLDRDDEIIRRRLAQKMDFLVADLAAMQDPTAADLKEWFARNSDRFAQPPRAGFRHLYFSTDKRGAHARDDAQAALGKVAGMAGDSPDAAAVADRFMFQDFYGDSTLDQVAKEFGPGFAKDLFSLAPGSWQGPIQSGYGWHLVWISSMEPGRVPAFEEVEQDVKAAWLDERYREIKQRAFEEMRARYTVVIPQFDDADLNNLQMPPGANLTSDSSTQ